MAAVVLKFYLFILLLHTTISKSAIDRRFSNFKRCSDGECSMLLCRGKAAQDYKGPDCRFLSFKKGETIYVYYKLSGKRTDAWAGSVGSRFGYFPKDLLIINHVYTDKELEIAAEETDFVCFDTGFDKFDNYDLDALLGSSEDTDSEEAMRENGDAAEKDNNGAIEDFGREVEAEEVGEDRELESTDSSPLPSEEQPQNGDTKPQESDTPEDLKDDLIVDQQAGENLKDDLIVDQQAGENLKDDLIVDQQAGENLKDDLIADQQAGESLKDDLIADQQAGESLKDDLIADQQAGESLKDDLIADQQAGENLKDDLIADQQAGESLKDDLIADQQAGESLKDDLIADQQAGENLKDDLIADQRAEGTAETLDEPKDEDGENTEHVSEWQKSPALKTKIGSTFDAITSDDEDTWRVTPYYEEDEEQEEEKSKEAGDPPGRREREDGARRPLISFTKEEPVLGPELVSEPAPPGEEPKEKGGIWSSLGDTVFKIVSGGERTEDMSSSEEEDEEDVEKEMEPEPEKNNNEEFDSVDLSSSDPHGETEDMAHSPKKIIFDEPAEVNIEESASDVPNAGSSTPEEEAEEGILSDEAAPEVDEEGDLTSSQPDSSALSPDKESISPDEGEPDPQMVPKESPETFPADEELPADEEPREPEHENVKLETHTQLDRTSQERHSEQKPEVSVEDVSPEDKQSGKSVFKNLNPSASGDENTGTDTGTDTEMDKRVHRAKKEIKHLLEDTLKMENIEPHPDQEGEEEKEELEEHRDGEEELLEDENAALSLSTAEHLDAEEEVSHGEEDGEELGPEEQEPDTESEKSEKPEATSDTRETEEEPAAGPSTEEDLPDEPRLPPPGDKVQYSDDVRRLTILRNHFEDEDMQRFRRYLGLQQLLRVEALFSALDEELRAARQAQAHSSQDVETTLEGILEASENAILDEIERMLDERELVRAHLQQPDVEMFDEEATILDDFQDLAFSLRKKYSTASDSEPLSPGNQGHTDEDGGHPEVAEDTPEDLTAEDLTAENLTAENLTAENLTTEDLTTENLAADNLTVENLTTENLTTEDLTTEDLTTENLTTENLVSDNLTAEHLTAENGAEAVEYEAEHVNELLESPLDSSLHTPDIGFKEDGGRFNKNKENQGIYKDTEEIQKGPQAILDNPLDVGFHFEGESSSSGSLDSTSVSDYPEDEPEEPPSLSILSEMGGLLLLAQECCGVYTDMLIAALPEDWQPGPTFRGVPWRAVASTAAVGIVTVIAFLWRSVLAVRSKTYLLTEKQLALRITQLCDEKSDALTKISQLKEKIVASEALLKESEKCASSTELENAELKESCERLQQRSEQSRAQLQSLRGEMEAERRRNQEQSAQISKTEKEMEKLKHIVKGNKDELSKVQLLMDEARLREEALKAQVTSFQKENSALKEKKKNLLREARDWEERHRELSEKIKVLQRSQQELGDVLEHKENEIEVLSDCITELRQLEACDGTELHRGGAAGLANGETAEKKSEAMKARIKQMLDVSRVKTTLSIVEEERNRYLEKLLAEEKERHNLEERIQALEHERASLQGEQALLQGQFHTIQQKLEIMNELYQQKENALQQKLTQEEFERRQKETRLTEVDGKALRAEEELRAYKLRIQEIEEELQKTERSYKTQIASHEKKAHENWLNARSAERALVEEKRETANLRQKLVEVSDKLVEFQRPLFKPTPGRPDPQILPMRRGGDSFGPSPVSGGAPSPPLMMEGPGRPPSAPVGRRAEPFGRPPSEPHGRFSDLGHPLPPRPDVCVPRTSSPSSLDASRLSKSGGPSFLASPIRDVPMPGPPMPGPPKGLGPPPPHGPPLNGHLPMMPPGPLAHEPRLPPPRHGMGPYGPPRPYGPPPPPYLRGPAPPMRDYPMGPPPYGPPDYRPEMRDPRDYPLPPRPLPPGARDHTGPPMPGGPLPLPPHMGPGPRNTAEGPHPSPGPRNTAEGPHPAPDLRRDSIPQQHPPRDTPTMPFNGP